MKLHILTMTFLLSTAAPASAWNTQTGEDPMTDEVYAVTTELQQGALPGQGIMMGIKCWKGKPDQFMIMLLTSEAFDGAATYPKLILAKVRVDKGTVNEVAFAPSNFDGQLGLTSSAGFEPLVLPTVKAFRDAKRRIAFEISQNQYQFSSAGSSKAIQKLAVACEVKLD